MRIGKKGRGLATVLAMVVALGTAFSVGGTKAEAADLKTKSFEIQHLPMGTGLGIIAFNDRTGAQAGDWASTAAGGSIGLSTRYNADGTVDYIVSFTNLNVTNWTPYVVVTFPAGMSYVWDGWERGPENGTGMNRVCTPVYHDAEVNAAGQIVTYVGAGFANAYLKANWHLAGHTVHFDGNGGTGVPADFTKMQGSISTIPSETPTRDGYTFVGWNTSSTATTAQYVAGSQYVYDQDGGTVTLYAVWTPITYTVHYDGNGATSGSTADQSATYGTAFNLRANGFSKQCSINYNGNGGTSSKSSDTINAVFNGWQDNNTMYYKGMYFNYFGFDAPYYINKHGDIGAAFGYNKYAALDHWYKNSIERGTENRQSSYNFKISDYMTYGGTDLRNSYGTNRLAYVTHWMNYGVYEGRTGALTVDTTTPDVYPNGAGVVNLATRQGERVTLTADWKMGSFTLPSAERTGHTFNGWYTSASGGTFVGKAGSKYTPSTNGSTLYAQWTRNKYTVTYDYATNGGKSATKTSASVYYEYDVDLSVTATKAGDTGTYSNSNKDGWQFVGWNTDANATTGLSSLKMPANNVTLYAIYKKDITLTYVDNNDSGKQTRTDKKTVYNKGTNASFSLASGRAPSGWTWVGWTKGTTPQSATVASPFSIIQDTTLYSEYQQKITISFVDSTQKTDVNETRYTNSYNFDSVKNPSVKAPAIADRYQWTTLGYTLRTDCEDTNSLVKPGSTNTYKQSCILYALYSKPVTLKYDSYNFLGTLEDSTGTKYANAYDVKKEK